MGICDSNNKTQVKNATISQATINTPTPQLTNSTATPQIINSPAQNYPQPTIPSSTPDKKYIRFENNAQNNAQNQAGLNVPVPGDFDRPSNIDRHVSLGSSINMDDSMGDNQPRDTLFS